MGINRSSFLYWQRRGKNALNKKIVFLQKVIEIYSEYNGIYGAPKIHHVLCEKGLNCSVSKVSRAMDMLGIRSIVAEKFVPRKSSLTEEEKDLIVNLVKDLSIIRINQVWTTDITYVKTVNEGTYYLITFIDLFSKKVLSWNLVDRQITEYIIDTLKVAVSNRQPGPGLIIHSDKGAQMRSSLYRNFLSKNNFVPSYTSLNHSCDENAAQESFHASLKKECLYLCKPKNFNEAFYLIHKYIDDFYNPVRLHSSLNYLSPISFEASL